jgi:hypothetical protein
LNVRCPSVGVAALLAVESRLSDGTPFGSCRYLSQRLSALYVQLLTVLAEHSDGARELLGALDRNDCSETVLRDPLVRRTLEDAVCTIVQGLEAIDLATLDEVLSGAAVRAIAGRGSVLDATAHCLPVGSAPHDAFVWADEQPNTVSGRRFLSELYKRLPGFRVHSPTDVQVQTLIAGRRLAFQVAPVLARSAMAHLVAVVVGDFRGGQPSVNALTVPGLPGVMLLSPSALSRRGSVAETLVHESMHLKFLDIDYVHPLFAIGFRPQSSPSVTPVWHETEPGYGAWPIDRVLTSMHVYLSLAVFFGIAASQQSHGLYASDDCAARVERCRTRAAWLFETAQDHLEYLSATGRAFVVAIGAMLSDLEAY